MWLWEIDLITKGQKVQQGITEKWRQFKNMYKRWLINSNNVEKLLHLKKQEGGGKYDQMIGLSTQNVLTFLLPSNTSVHK